MMTFQELIARPEPRLLDLGPSPASNFEVHGTTVLATKFNGGVLTVSDRRATAGNLIMYEQAEKVMALDDDTVIAISGAFARSVEICRMLKHSFKFYRRMTLQEMSMEGKLMEISRALSDNAPMAMQGIGVFLPIVSAYDKKKGTFNIYFFDGAGARFQNGDYAYAGSGSSGISGTFRYLERTKGPFETRPMEDVLADLLELLDIAAELDSATGGFSRRLPVARVLDANGNRLVDPALMQRIASTVLDKR